MAYRSEFHLLTGMILQVKITPPCSCWTKRFQFLGQAPVRSFVASDFQVPRFLGKAKWLGGAPKKTGGSYVQLSFRNFCGFGEMWLIFMTIYSNHTCRGCNSTPFIIGFLGGPSCSRSRLPKLNFDLKLFKQILDHFCWHRVVHFLEA